MFSAWDFNKWMISAGIVLLLASLIAFFAAVVTEIIIRIWGEERGVVPPLRMSEAEQKAPSRKAA
ncbi:MAG TPA: hypothetical protein VLD60_07755 [Nitrospira sp.]|nr:hypothetical protein [Nitrospira sp.]